jgi:hypothetical protein
VLPQYTLPAADLFVYYLNRRNQAARTRAFIDFLVEHFRRSEGDFALAGEISPAESFRDISGVSGRIE